MVFQRSGLRRAALVAGRLTIGCALSGCATDRISLTGAQTQQVARVQGWIDHVHGLAARFQQVFPDGGIGQGTVSYDPPGRLRLDYAPGHDVTLVANAGRITYTDARTGSTTRMAAAATPFGLLLEGDVRLGGAVRVTDVRSAGGTLQISLARADRPQSGLLTLDFENAVDGSLLLTRIEAVDAERHRTSLRLFDEQFGRSFPAGTFVPPALS